MKQVPENLYGMLEQQYGKEETMRIIHGYAQRRPVTLRVNTLKTTIEMVKSELTREKIIYDTVEWSDEALIIRKVREVDLQALYIYQQGHIYLQSLSSMLPPLVLKPKKEASILDMAAAPGGKTTQIAALTDNKAQITACEKNKIRAERLNYNIQKQGVKGVYIMHADATKLDELFSFDQILLDAPCSGSGTISLWKDRVDFSENLLERSIKTQRAMLKKALHILKSGGEMVYSTCSILARENEQMIHEILDSGMAELVPIDSGLKENLPLLPSALPETLCIRPNELYEGFFLAKLKKR